jgi:hypothetical protein
MRRDRPPRAPLAGILAERWRRADDPRAQALAAGETVAVSESELPADHRSEPADRCLGYPDDYVLSADGLLERSLGYWRRRLSEPHRVWRDGAWHEVPAVWRDGAWRTER